MTSLDKLLYEALNGNYPPIEGGVDIETLRLTDKQIDGVTIVTDADGKIKVSDNFVGGGTTNPIEVADVDGLQALLDDKAEGIHKHEIADVTGLQTALNGKSPSVHKHQITDVSDLQVELDEKALKTDFNNLKNNFDTHTHEIAEITNLQDELNKKALLTHTHTWADVLNKPTSTVAQIDKTVTDSHVHPNPVVLNGLEDGGGILLYNGSPLGEASFLSVRNITERDAIPLDARKEGLTVLTTDDNSIYYLKDGIDDAFWTIFSVGAGGATNASTLPATPPTGLIGTNAQALIDELSVNKANQADVYTKAETENFVKNREIDYDTLLNLPDLSTLHPHDNKATLDLFDQFQGNLTWDGKTLGDLVTEIYDADGNSIIDMAQKLSGVNATPEELNYVSGATGNLQAQINSLSSGVTFRGTFPTYADMVAKLATPTKGDLVYIETDETQNGALDTQYVFDGTAFVYGGGTTKTPDATLTTKGVIQLGGDLAHPNSTAVAPKLTPTGVTAGLYKSANITLGEDGRVTHAEEGNQVFLNDAIISTTEGWSSQKVNDELAKKAERNHTHAQLHNANMLGKVELDENNLPLNNQVITYDQVNAKAIWKNPQGGKFILGSKQYQGDLTLRSGSYITLLLDEVTGELTINASLREGIGQNMIPSGFEINGSIEIDGGKSKRFSVDSGFDKVMLHTVQLMSSKDVVAEIKLYNQAANADGIGGFVEYASNPELMVSDIVNIPVFDNDSSKKLHLEILNLGIESAIFNYRLKCTNLL